LNKRTNDDDDEEMIEWRAKKNEKGEREREKEKIWYERTNKEIRCVCSCRSVTLSE
jgi:hypothetical protein